MKRDFLLFLLCTVIFTFISIYAKAQVVQGGFGSVYTGPFYQVNASLQKDLSSDKLLGSAFKGNLLVASYGAEGFSVWRSGILVGGNINFSTSTSRAENGSVTENTTAGFVTLGYKVASKKRWLAFSYVGAGAFGASFNIANYGPQVFRVDKDSIMRGQSGKYSAGGMAFDLGFAVKYFALNYEMRHSKKLKPMIGLNTGISFFPAFQKWRNTATENKIETFNTPFIMAIYARITLGLGVFSTQ